MSIRLTITTADGHTTTKMFETQLEGEVWVYNRILKKNQIQIQTILDVTNHLEMQPLKKTLIYAYNVNLELFKKYKEKTMKEMMKRMETAQENVEEGSLPEGDYIELCDTFMLINKKLDDRKKILDNLLARKQRFAQAQIEDAQADLANLQAQIADTQARLGVLRGHLEE
tara:strand:- start:11 stop:520 length:510 start_codon:yes stop_codon:yes gene_type:complete